jgi:hypothetical protein
MVGKTLLVPVSIFRFCAGVGLLFVRLCLSVISGILRFGCGRIFGAVFGASVGALGGKRHVRVKWFPKR